MKKAMLLSTNRLGLLLGVAVLPAIVGCYTDSSRSPRYERPPSGYLQGGVYFEDDYVYYPGYEVYYSSRRHSYVYLDGRNWVTRPVPPRVQIEVLMASPSVRVDFHDAPAQHHATVIRQYPKNWKPADPRPEAPPRSHKSDEKADHHKNGHKFEKDDENEQHH